jgi:L-ascorbate metabolism protein UlaG (beta-lactamase superfamily)
MTFGGNATMLLELGPFTVLTDPNFLHRGQRAYLGKGLFSKRLLEPALPPRDVPPLDAVVLSHLHGDHFDRVARARLARDVPIMTTPKAAGRLLRQGFDASGLATWQGRRISRGPYRLDVTAVPGRHGPPVAYRAMPPVMGSVVDLSHGDRRLLRLYITGDTLCYPDLREIAERYPGIDAALIHLGGTRAFGVLVTMDARHGVDLLSLVRPAAAVPVHFEEYSVMRDPLSAFLDRARERNVCPVVVPGRGQTLDLLADVVRPARTAAVDGSGPAGTRGGHPRG